MNPAIVPHIDELAPLLHALGVAELHRATPNAYPDFVRGGGLLDHGDRHLDDHSPRHRELGLRRVCDRTHDGSADG